MSPAAEVRAIDGRQEIGQGSGEVARPHVPGPEPRMRVSHGIGKEVLAHLVEYGVAAAAGPRAVAIGTVPGQHRGIGCQTGLSRTLLDMRHGEVDHLVGQRSPHPSSRRDRASLRSVR